MKPITKKLFAGLTVAGLVAAFLTFITMRPTDYIREESNWIKIDTDCNIPNPSIFRDYRETFDVSYKLLQALPS